MEAFARIPRVFKYRQKVLSPPLIEQSLASYATEVQDNAGAAVWHTHTYKIKKTEYIELPRQVKSFTN